MLGSYKQRLYLMTLLPGNLAAGFSGNLTTALFGTLMTAFSGNLATVFSGYLMTLLPGNLATGFSGYLTTALFGTLLTAFFYSEINKIYISTSTGQVSITPRLYFKMAGNTFQNIRWVILSKWYSGQIRPRFIKFHILQVFLYLNNVL